MGEFDTTEIYLNKVVVKKIELGLDAWLKWQSSHPASMKP
jgi:hypothetical protein